MVSSELVDVGAGWQKQLMGRMCSYGLGAKSMKTLPCQIGERSSKQELGAVLFIADIAFCCLTIVHSAHIYAARHGAWNETGKIGM